MNNGNAVERNSTIYICTIYLKYRNYTNTRTIIAYQMRQLVMVDDRNYSYTKKYNIFGCFHSEVLRTVYIFYSIRRPHVTFARFQSKSLLYEFHCLLNFEEKVSATSYYQRLKSVTKNDAMSEQIQIVKL